MGLDTSHGCWRGAYSAFMRWREHLVKQAWGVNIKDLPGYNNSWEEANPHARYPHGAEDDALYPLINHSDSGGELEWKICGPLADRLQELIDRYPDDNFGGHVGSWHDKTKTFIAGLRDAFAAQENVEFY